MLNVLLQQSEKYLCGMQSDRKTIIRFGFCGSRADYIGTFDCIRVTLDQT
jgi:hypothetical protein